MKASFHFVTAAVLLLLTAPSRCADDGQPLAADAFVRVTLIDRTKKAMKVFIPTKPGELVLPQLGTMTFTGVLPAEFAKRIKASYIERGIYTAETLTVVFEVIPPGAPDIHRPPTSIPLKNYSPPPRLPRPAPDYEPLKQKGRNA